MSGFFAWFHTTGRRPALLQGVTVALLSSVLVSCEKAAQDGVDESRCSAPGELGAVDADGDGLANTCDNCPATANGTQADADGDGLGDECDGVTASGFAIRTSEGIVETAFDERGRPSLLVAGGRSAEFNWSDDATQVDVTIHDDLGSLTVNLPVDLSDEALSALLDETERETGINPTALREGLAENPGLVARVAAGLEQAPGTAKCWDAAACRAKTGPNLQVGDQSATEIAMRYYLGGLLYKAMILGNARYEMRGAYRQYLEHFGQMEPEEETRARALIDAAARLESQAYNTHDSQFAVCIPCTSDCMLGCDSLGLGACCTFQGAISSCLDDIQEEACQETDGSDYHPGSFCAALECGAAGACCFSIGCVDMGGTLCVLGGGKFEEGRTCAETDCGNGACYSTYTDRGGNLACCDCRSDMSDEACQAVPNFYFFTRAEQCPGACYIGEGIEGYCLHESGFECQGDGGIFFHDSLCAGICTYADDGCEFLTDHECQQLSGLMWTGLDSCGGACDYYLVGAQGAEYKCTVVGGPAGCSALEGTFYLGETCP